MSYLSEKNDMSFTYYLHCITRNLKISRNLHKNSFPILRNLMKIYYQLIVSSMEEIETHVLNFTGNNFHHPTSLGKTAKIMPGETLLFYTDYRTRMIAYLGFFIQCKAHHLTIHH